MELTQKYVRELYTYDGENGFLIRNYSKGTSKKGSIVGCNHDGYLRTKVDKKPFMVHRLIWLYAYGELPKDHIDHINHIKNDNRIGNLRAVEEHINHKNKPMQHNNKSGTTGVRWHKRMERWTVTININKKRKQIGSFKNKEDAISLRKKAELDNNYHANHGKFTPKSN